LAAEESSHSHSRKNTLVRVAAVIAVAQALEGDNVNWHGASAIFKTIGQGVAARCVGDHILAFLQRWWTAFIMTGSVHDAPRSGRPPLVPDDVAAEAAELVKLGQWVPRFARGQRLEERVLFRSIPQAIRAVPRLGQICQQHGVTSEQLRNAMERVDSDLVRRTLHFKYAHSAEQLEERQSFCQRTLALLGAMPAEQSPILDRMVWWDEGGVSLCSLENRAVRVWGSRDALQNCDVLHLPAVQGQKDCKIHFGIGVTSHPKFAHCNGLVHFEFTTGTTFMKRLKNKFAADGQEEHEYQVSTTLVTYQVAKGIVPHKAVHVYCLQQLHHMHLCFAHETAGEHHTLLSSCNSNGCQHCLWLLQVTFVHTHQTHTCVEGCEIAQEIPVTHRGCAAGVHAMPMTRTINLHKYILTPIVEVKATTPHVVPHLMAPMLAAPMSTEQPHKQQLIVGDERLARRLPTTCIIHAKGAPQVRCLVDGLRGAILVVLLPAVAANQPKKQLVVLLAYPDVAPLSLFVGEACLSSCMHSQAVVHACCASQALQHETRQPLCAWHAALCTCRPRRASMPSQQWAMRLKTT
jgi:hypothetical protein